jgi:probable phosphoglycerate mutase
MNQPAHLCITRHGETDWNAAGVLQGWIDVPINRRGREQADELAEQFRDAGFARIYTSPLIRSSETADKIATTLGLSPPTVHEGLKERYFGVIQGIPKSELAELNPILYQNIASRNPAIDFEQGESMDDFADRILGALMDIGTQNAGDRLLVITHGWAMDTITRHVRGLPRSAILHLKRRNGECLWVEATPESVSLLKDERH